MGYLTFVSYSILINGDASSLFHVERGLRKGCHISPLLFLLIMEGFSRLIKKCREDGSLTGVWISNMSSITHLLFVDDVLIFLNGSFKDSYVFKSILSLFCKAIGMEQNFEKSTIIIVTCQPHETRFACQKFDYVRQDLDVALKYLGFKLKLDGYRIAD